MRVRTLIAALALAASPALAAEPAPAEVRCQATMQFSCQAGACTTEIDEAGVPIEVTYEPQSRRGDLCTYTYCRGFELRAQPSARGQEREAHSGFTLSEHSGSTPEFQNRPVVDFQLTFAEDFSRFTLANVQNGGVGGWAGACTVGAP